jgi:glycosyltransferase involved in cell wall biosynthesis
MKILHVYKTFLGESYGGIEQSIAQIACSSSHDIEHKVVSLSKNNNEVEIIAHGVPNLCFKQELNLASNGMSLSLLKNFNKLTQNFDLIHYHFPWPWADFMHLYCQIKKPSIVTYHSDIVRQKFLSWLYKPLMYQFLSSVNQIIATSPNYLSTSPVLKKYMNKVKVIPLGLNKNYYPNPTQEEHDFWENKYGKHFFLFIGTMRYYKGLHILLEALKNTNFPVLIVGSGPLENELKLKAQKLHLNQVHFLGQISETSKMVLLKLCIAMLFPSNFRSEAFGISLLEGAMLGKPLISSELGTGTSYINIHNKTGIVIQPNDSDALKHAIQFLWENPKEQARMGKNASDRFQELFTSDKMAKEYKKIYIETINTF